jgi:glycosyltransferase involved in cell wall biosynthesis
VKPTPFFSIVIPTYNRAGLLRTAVDSVLKQTFTDWELIIVDDGSTDNTSEVVRAIEDERVKYIYQVNAERCAARNNGIEHANGRYICFLDSDDYYLAERLAILYKSLEQLSFPIGMFYTGLLIDRDGNVNRQPVDYGACDDVFENIATHIIHSQQVCISREILAEFKYDRRFRIGEDMELWLRIAQNYPVSYLKEQFTVAVREHDDRSVNVMRYNTGAEQLRLYRYIFTGAHSGGKISDEAKRFMLAGCYHAIAQYNIHQGNRWAASMAILQALAADKNSAWSKFRINIFLKLVSFASLEKVKGLIDYAL